MHFKHLRITNENLNFSVASRRKQPIFKEMLANIANVLFYQLFNCISIKIISYFTVFPICTLPTLKYIKKSLKSILTVVLNDDVITVLVTYVKLLLSTLERC